jgi:hypothetical protein
MSERLFKNFYNRVANIDLLGQLTDEQLVARIVSTPNRIKKAAQKLLKELDKYGVTLDSQGLLDFSRCKNEEARVLLQKNPEARAVLMQRDLFF